MTIAREHAGVFYMAGVACMELGRVPQAVAYLREATRLDSTRTGFATAYAKALMLAGDHQQAVVEADRVADFTKDAAGLETLGMIYALAQSHERAAATLNRAVVRSPRNAATRFILATTLIFLGDLKSAERELEACISLDPGHWKAYLTLSQVTTQSVEHNLVDMLVPVLARQTANVSEGRMYLNLALAKSYEDMADYSRAFQHLRAGKRAASTGPAYSTQKDKDLFASIIETTRDFARETFGHPSTEPIFVMGMPRTGTTLADRILSRRKDVRSAGEMLNFALALKRQSGSTSSSLIDPDTMMMSGHLNWLELGEQYLTSLPSATEKHARFIDKMPHNFLYAGHIAKALPNARIICLRRDPMDTCLSNFRQLFSSNLPFFGYSFDLLDTGRYYLLFDQLIAHWRQLLPGRVLEMAYEDLVSSQETTSRRLLEFCGLEWNDDCLNFEKNPSAVASASAIQVRRAMYPDAIHRWKKYRPQLEELHELLAGAGVIPLSID